MRRHRSTVWHVCWRFAHQSRGNQADRLARAEDMAQEVWIMLWLKFDQLNPNCTERQQRRWLERLVKSVLIDLYRHESGDALSDATALSDEPDLPEDKKPSLEEVLKVWENFKSLPQELKLPSAPEHPIVYREEENRPQPNRDRDTEKGMACVLGRLRKCNVFDIKFVALSHNTVRGAAGGAVLCAEALVSLGYIQKK